MQQATPATQPRLSPKSAAMAAAGYVATQHPVLAARREREQRRNGGAK